MVFLNFVAAGLLVGALLGGRLEALAGLRIRWWWLVFLAIALQVAAFPSGVLPWSTPDGFASALWVGSYAVLGAVIVRNVRIPGVALVGLGTLCNVVAIVANGGHMPVTRGALDAAGLSYELRNNSISLADPHLSLLVDRWAVPGWLPLGNVYSICDVLIGVGILAAIVIGMRPRIVRPRYSSATGT
jgi:Family of unknown function (DUF5317)